MGVFRSSAQRMRYSRKVLSAQTGYHAVSLGASADGDQCKPACRNSGGLPMRHTTRQTRANRTITVDFQNEATYYQLLGDGKAFIECVLAFLSALGFQLKHKATCGGGGCLTRHSHY